MESSACEFLLMEMTEYFWRVACHVKEHDGLILLKLKFIGINLLKPNDIYIYIYIYIYMSYRSANLQTLHFKYLFNKDTYWIF